MTPELVNEGLARELVNRIQNLRKDKGLEVTDRIKLTIEKSADTFDAFEQFKDYICSETLAQINFTDHLEGNTPEQVDLVDGIRAKLKIEKIEY
jgi:isoleucyl-tRNA synthetase